VLLGYKKLSISFFNFIIYSRDTKPVKNVIDRIAFDESINSSLNT